MRPVGYVLLGLALLGCRKTAVVGDADSDGIVDTEDCTPFAANDVEVCDGFDNDCNGLVDDAPTDGTMWYSDSDYDGFGSSDPPLVACQAPANYVANAADCDDRDAAYHPGAPESDCTDAADYNCDDSTGYADADGDGVPACEDCDDDDAEVHPGADELCDGADDDCDGDIDDAATDTTDFALDIDGDGHGNANYTVSSCDDAVAGYVPVAEADDCDDLSASSFPGAAEDCDGEDNDCDGEIDEGAKGQLPYYPDGDQDGYGDIDGEVTVCERPAGFVSDFTDCNDTDARFNPAAVETCSDTTDYNCDGSVGQDDADKDGAVACKDCDDGRADVKPGAAELCDGVDNDCNAKIDENAPTWYADVDGDGRGGDNQTVVLCAAPGGYVSSKDDCDDLDASSVPGGSEICDGVDNDCNGAVPTTEADADRDGFMGCEGDCDDKTALTGPVGREVCNGVDDDCDSGVDEAGSVDSQTWFADVDGDGYGTSKSTKSGCSAPIGYVGNDRDCNDGTKATNPGATESCDAADNDCDGEIDEASASNATVWYADSDGDGYGSGVSTKACTAPAGFVSKAGDCDDGDAARRPLATELCNGLDDDCASGVPATEADADKDGFRACAECDDTVAITHPGAIEICDTRDNNCDGNKDESAIGGALYWRDGDGDGFGTTNQSTSACALPGGYASKAGDCDDAKANTFPGAVLACDGTDRDCDGDVDNDADSDGFASSACGGKDCNDFNPSFPDKNGLCLYLSCADALLNGQTASGPLTIDPDGTGGDAPMTVYCDQVRDGGGWTLVMKQAANAGLSSPLAVQTWTGWGAPRVTLNATDASTNDGYMVNLAYSTLVATNLRMTGSTWVDASSGAWLRSIPTGTAYSALSNANATPADPAGAVTTPWPTAAFTSASTITTTGNALCWRSKPQFNTSPYEYAGNFKWGYYFNNECGPTTTDTTEGLGCCSNASWYRSSAWTLYVWAR